mgnify:CR=1 FL=1
MASQLTQLKSQIDALSPEEKDRIEMVITCTESAFDFGKSMSTYCHDLLGLNRNCRLFELKNACYSGVAGLQMAVNFVLSQVSPGGKVLVVHPQAQIRKVLDIVQALPVSDIFASTAEVDAYLDKLQREMLQGDDAS